MSILLGFLRRSSSGSNGVLPFTRSVVQKDRGTIIVLSAYGLGNAITGIMPMIVEPLRRYSADICLVDLNAPGWQADFEKAIANPVWFVASYFGVGQDLYPVEHNGVKYNFWEYFGIPFIRFYGDIPAYFPDRHATASGNVANVYFDPDHEAFFKNYFPGRGASVWLPPIPNGGVLKKSVDVSKKLRGKIVFPKNGGSPDELIDFWRRSLPRMICKVIEDVSDECVSLRKVDSRIRIDEEFLNYFSSYGLGVDKFASVLSFMVAQVDDYLRRVKSTLVVKALLDLPVVVNGVGWDHVNFSGRCASYDPDCDFFSTEKKMPGYLAVIDSPPNTNYLVHDRISRAVGERTAFITARHLLLEERMMGFDEAFYSYTPDSVVQVVSRFVDDPTWAVDFGLAQSEKFFSAFPFSDYADKLLMLVDVVKLNSGGRPEGTQFNVSFPSRCF
ncbi:hypothetical protein [Uliginosibacterium sp. 31-12]|uniref:hypothetical protein n=1 Tax=Uliginosibacterium sp. 31-12 TaxID=3062781 RepID=UPI0026E2DB2C|nr:hypothetical protein [Uliginosibacterium sp. 31-12]MDO6384979.1 hypothetical protein [Uliginosibacterium sp. 31-12]